MRMPDVVVLAAGGTLGEAWMSGLLSGVAEQAGFEFDDVRTFVGTSAGSIVAARLHSGRMPRRPRGGATADVPPEPAATPPPRRRPGPALRVLGSAVRAATAAAAPIALRAGAPVGAFARSAALGRFPGGGDRSLDDLRRRVERWDSRFDGRLLVCAVDVASGRRVVFGSDDAPEARVADAVQASCSIPGVFAPTEIGGRSYVDGGVWSFTNLDAAPVQRGDRVLCLSPIANVALGLPAPMAAVRHAAEAAASVEAAALRHAGASVQRVGPDAEVGRLMARSLMDPGPRDAVWDGGRRQGIRLARTR